MSDEQGPWGESRPPSRPPQTRQDWPRAALFIAICVGITLLFVWLARTYARPLDGEDWTYLAQTLGVMVLCVSALLARRLKLGDVVRYTLIWTAILAVLVVGYTLGPQLGALGADLLTKIAPAPPKSETITQSDDGGYYLTARVHGGPVVSFRARRTFLKRAELAFKGRRLILHDRPGA